VQKRNADLYDYYEPSDYLSKKKLLLSNNIGIWDVAHTAIRKGSLDSNIKNEVPNDLLSFIAANTNLSIIGFNGKKSEKLFNEYFTRSDKITYITLPSTSPAHTIAFEKKLEIWKRLL